MLELRTVNVCGPSEDTIAHHDSPYGPVISSSRCCRVRVIMSGVSASVDLCTISAASAAEEKR